MLEGTIGWSYGEDGGNRPLERPIRKWITLRWISQELGCEGRRLIEMDQDLVKFSGFGICGIEPWCYVDLVLLTAVSVGFATENADLC
jgi:hypothetical protein